MTWLERLLGVEPPLTLDEVEIPPPDEMTPDETPLYDIGDDDTIAYEAEHAPPPPWRQS